MAVMGPAVSAVLAGAFIAISEGLKPNVSTETYGVLRYLGVLNAALAAFNMAPAFPLDGGRVLRALVWLRTRDPLKATQVAASVGEGIAWLMMGLGAVATLGGGVAGGLWWLILGFYILLMARAHRAQAETQSLLAGARVADVMTPDPVTAPGAVSVEEFVRDYLAHHPHDLIPVLEGGSVAGGAGFKEVMKVARGAWPRTRLSEIATPLREIPTASPNEDVSVALGRMQGQGASRLLVLRGDRVMGILTLKDVLAHVRVRAVLSAPEGGR
jgi:CBS domain-containing protein